MNIYVHALSNVLLLLSSLLGLRLVRYSWTSSNMLGICLLILRVPTNIYSPRPHGSGDLWRVGRVPRRPRGRFQTPRRQRWPIAFRAAPPGIADGPGPQSWRVEAFIVRRQSPQLCF